MTERQLWTDEDELGFKIGDMHGEWQRPVEKPKNPRPTLPARRLPKLEVEKKHIKKTGKK